MHLEPWSLRPNELPTCLHKILQYPKRLLQLAGIANTTRTPQNRICIATAVTLLDSITQYAANKHKSMARSPVQLDGLLYPRTPEHVHPAYILLHDALSMTTLEYEKRSISTSSDTVIRNKNPYSPPARVTQNHATISSTLQASKTIC